MTSRKRNRLIFWESVSTISLFDVGGWFSARGIPEEEAERRYLAAAVIGLLFVGACSVSVWVFLHWNIVAAMIVCIASWVIAFIVALWAVERILPPKIHSER
jgi:hypothetical protein